MPVRIPAQAPNRTGGRCCRPLSSLLRGRTGKHWIAWITVSHQAADVVLIAFLPDRS